MPNLGMTKGLSFANNWDNDIARLYQREELAARIRTEKERKTQYYANLLKQGHASNPRAEKELTEYYKGLNNELADIVIQNPDLETNVTAMEKFLNVSDRYINNDILRIDKQVAGEFEKLRNAVSQGVLEPDEYEAEMKRYDQYINSNPGEAVEPYVFTNYPKVTTDELISDTVKNIGVAESAPVLNDNTGQWETTITAPENKLLLQTASVYSVPKNKRVIERDFQSYAEQNPAVKAKYSGPDGALIWYQDRTRAAIDVRKAQTGIDLMMKESFEQGKSAVSEYALSNKVKTLVEMAGAGDDSASWPAVDYDTNLTAMGTSKTIEFKASNGIMSGATKETIDFGSKSGIVFVKDGYGKWVTVGGLPYLEVIGHVDNPVDSPTSAEVASALSKAGFDQKEYSSDSPIPNFDDKITKGLRHTGTILIPMKISPDGLSVWAKEHGGQKEQDVANQYYGTDFVKTQAEIYNKKGILIDKGIPAKEVSQLEQEEGRYFTGVKNGIKVVVDKKTGNYYDYNDVK
jgi:hypothetical protein